MESALATLEEWCDATVIIRFSRSPTVFFVFDQIDPGIIRLIQGRELFDTTMDGMETEMMKGFNWESIISRCDICMNRINDA